MNQKLIVQLLEVLLHVILIVGVPLLYLEFATGFNKYRLPEHMTYVYLYWLAYIFITVAVYGAYRKK